MRLPHLSLGAETLLDTHGLYHLTQLQADPELTDLTGSFRQAQVASLVAMAVRD